MGMTDPDFNSIGWSLSSEPGLQCTTNAISVSARPDKWRAALYTALQEIGRLALHGVTAAELEQSLTTIRNHFAQQAEQRDQQTSSAWMRRIMDSVHGRDALVHPDDKFAVLQRLCDATTLEAVNVRTRENLAPFLRMLDDTSKMTVLTHPPVTPSPSVRSAPRLRAARAARARLSVRGEGWGRRRLCSSRRGRQTPWTKRASWRRWSAGSRRPARRRRCRTSASSSRPPSSTRALRRSAPRLSRAPSTSPAASASSSSPTGCPAPSLLQQTRRGASASQAERAGRGARG